MRGRRQDGCRAHPGCWSSATSPIWRLQFERIAEERLAKVKVELAKRGETEAKLLTELLDQQRKRIAKANAEFDPNQLLLPGIAEGERREREADRRHWQNRLARLESEIRNEPARIRASYNVHAHRLEPVGLVYLWPSSG